LIRPDAHLRKLIAEASPEQNARAVLKAKAWLTMCKRLGIEPVEAGRVLKEALEMEISGEADVPDVADVDKSKEDLFTRRQYSGNYREP
jgi:hypothetical protein